VAHHIDGAALLDRFFHRVLEGQGRRGHPGGTDVRSKMTESQLVMRVCSLRSPCATPKIMAH